MSEPSESDTTPTMVVLHGLTGGSNETYVRNSVVELSKSREEGGLGFRCVVINYRGCSETMLTSTQLYSAAKVTDLESALLLLTHMFPNSPMLGLGFSLGGAILSRYMGVVGKNTPLIGAISVGAPYTFDKSNEWMESSYVARAYTYVLGSGLYDRVRLSADTLALSPELWRPLELLLRIKIDPDEQKPIAKPEPGSAPHGTVRFFDNTLTRLIGGYPSPYGEFPFSDAWEYYRRGNSVNVVSNVARPMLALTADDDPIVPWHVLPAMVEGVKTNPNVVLAHSESGGHLGWFAGPRGERWIKHPIAQFASAMFDAHAEKAKNSSTLPPTGLGSGGPQLSPWKTRTIVPRPVQVEVLPKSALPHVLPEKERLPVRDNDKDESVSELVWLRTHILTHIPLVHPNDSPACKEPVPPGRMLNLTLVRTCTLTQQHCDSLRPELGFIELPDDVRVCTYHHPTYMQAATIATCKATSFCGRCPCKRTSRKHQACRIDMTVAKLNRRLHTPIYPAPKQR